jgi:hypothetical protein
MKIAGAIFTASQVPQVLEWYGLSMKSVPRLLSGNRNRNGLVIDEHTKVITLRLGGPYRLEQANVSMRIVDRTSNLGSG